MARQPARHQTQPYHTSRIARALAASAPRPDIRPYSGWTTKHTRHPGATHAIQMEDLVHHREVAGHPTTHAHTCARCRGIIQAGDDRSFANYFTQARQEHRTLTGNDPPDVYRTSNRQSRSPHQSVAQGVGRPSKRHTVHALSVHFASTWFRTAQDGWQLHNPNHWGSIQWKRI